MNIGILNTGNIGSRLARAWAAEGHQLVLTKDGKDRKIVPLLVELGDSAELGTVRQAAEFADAALFSVYWPRRCLRRRPGRRPQPSRTSSMPPMTPGPVERARVA